MVGSVTEKKLCLKKIIRIVFPYDFCQKKSSFISLKTSYSYFRQLLSNIATFFCPTNKDSIQKERFKPIGFLIRVKKVQDEKHTGARYLISNFERYFFWTLVQPKSKVKVIFFIECKKNHSSGVPIWLLAHKKFFCHIVENITKILQTTFERFLMTISSVGTNLVKFCPKKNLTSNGSKPIRVLTCTKSSCSDECLPIH